MTLGIMEDLANFEPTSSLKITHRISMRWGGIAGDGLQSTGRLFQKYLNRIGYHVFGFPGTQSTIRGGHVWQHIEISQDRLRSFDQQLDILIALNTQTVEVHLDLMKNNGVLIYNSNKVDLSQLEDVLVEKQIELMPLPLTSLAREIDIKTPILANTIAIGFIIKLFNMPMDDYHAILSNRFASRPSILEMNKKALAIGHSLQVASSVMFTLEPLTNGNGSNIVVSGNEMIALGAASAGLKFLAQYPITPASSILTYLQQRAKQFGIVVKQAEDELAAITMCIGASFAGARAMTASSGPGLSLMAEAFGYAAMTETPLVIVNSMRGGPSTGVPTQMEQSDLQSMISLSHGESPRAIFAPRSIEDCFHLTAHAFNIADRYQVPVIILSDFALSESTTSIEPFDLQVEIDRGLIWEPSEEDPEFKRYKLTVDGISPRTFPPQKGAEFILVGAEHDEKSHSLSGNRCGLPLSKDLKEQMQKKRFRKLEVLRDEMGVPSFYGVENADHTIIGWGSTQGALQEAVDKLNGEGTDTWNLLSFSELFPLPYSKIRELLGKVNHSIMFEVNYTGQFENLIHHHLGWRADDRIHPLKGDTPTPDLILRHIQKLLPNRSQESGIGITYRDNNTGIMPK